jgi:UDP-N-acetylmuramoylalanine--D-glutamate ligase
MELTNKKVLLVGLGILGGGLSMAQYLHKNGAKVTITDLRDKKTLEPMIRKLSKDVSYTIGEHKEADFKNADLIVFNPAVPFLSPWVKLAKKLNIEFYNDYTFFLKNLETLNPNALIIGVTGTRGKTTTTMWINHLIPGSVLAGNIPEKNLLKQMTKKTEVFVLELSSFQLEYAGEKTKAPNIAVFTNLYTDHLNRYGTFDKYRDVKFNIFKNQTAKDVLVLNSDEAVTKEVLATKPKAQLFFISKKPLPSNRNGLFFNGDSVVYQLDGKKIEATKVKGLAPHEKDNLLTAMLVAHLVGMDGTDINELIKDLPNPILRQQKVFEDKNFTIINDSAGTSPEATMAAIEKFRKDKNFVLITGGTNKDLNFKDLAQKISKNVKLKNLFLLEGSATDLLIPELSLLYSKEVGAYENLEDIIDVVSQEFDKATIVFSPGCASFEKFKNEFDRGEKFNKLVRKYFGKI